MQMFLMGLLKKFVFGNQTYDLQLWHKIQLLASVAMWIFIKSVNMSSESRDTFKRKEVLKLSLHFTCIIYQQGD